MERSLNATLAGGIAAMIIAMGIGRFAYTPLLPAMQEAVGFGDGAAGALASANYLGYLLGALALAAIPLGARRVGVLRLCLIASIATTAAMAATRSLALWGALRLLSGLASAGIFVLAATVVHAALSRHGRLNRMGVHFSGVGCGIALSGIVVAAARDLGWQAGWLLLAALCVAALIPAWRNLRDRPAPMSPAPQSPARTPVAAAPPSLPAAPPVHLPVWALAVAYFCAGAGYIVTGTFLVAIARSTPSLASWAEHLWTIVGLAAAPAAALWSAIAHRIGRVPALIAAHLCQALGIILPVLSGAPAAAVVAAVLFGSTFVGIAALSVALAAAIAPAHAARAIGLVTAAFGVGQIIGPLVAGWLAAMTAGFDVALTVAALVVAVGAAPLLLGLGAQPAPVAAARLGD